MPMPTPTYEEMLALVEQRVPDFPADRKSTIATAALAVLGESMQKDRSPMDAVKVAVARSYRRST